MKMKGKYLFLAICAICLTGCSLSEEKPSKTGQIQTESLEQIRENEQSEIPKQIEGNTQAETLKQSEEDEQTETLKQVEGGIQVEEDYTLDLKDLMDMLGMKDEDTANLLGGGGENWTDDKSFYIGRIYQTDIYGDNYKIFTTCGKDRTVESVSLWIVDGERKVVDTEVQEWEERVTDIMGVDPIRDVGVSEGGSRNIRWMADGMVVSMNRMEDILTIHFQCAVGELK